jgi:hypothetical protein
MKKLLAAALPVALALGLAVPATAKVERLTLDDMVARTDNTLDAEIVARQVFLIDHPVDGDLYFTKLTVSGRSLRDGRVTTADVVYPGGFLPDGRGVWNSEAPSDEDVRLGNRVVVFYKFVDNLGGGLSANALYASHGGIFRTQNGPAGRVVLGRGEGYAIPFNTKIESVGLAVRTIVDQQQSK